MGALHSLLLFAILAFLTACKPGAKVAEIESGVEAELTSMENFTYAFGERVVNGNYIGTFNLSNSGKFPISGLSATPLPSEGNLIYTGGTFPGANGTCGNVIEQGKSCVVEFEFRPDHEGQYHYAIDLDFNTGIGAKKKTLNVTGYAGTIAFLKLNDNADLDFGIHETGEVVERFYNIKNAGGLTAKNMQPLPLEAPFHYKGGTYPGIGGTCAYTLGAYQDCTIVVVMTSTIYENASKSISIDYQNGNGATNFSAAVSTLIVSVEAELAFLAGGTQDYGSTILQKGVTKKFKLMNRGYLDATDLTFNNSANVIFGTNDCTGNKIEKSKFCEVNVIFMPNVVGESTESVSISYQSGKSLRSVSLSAKGIGIAPANLIFNPLFVSDFGVQAVNSEKILELQIKNSGDYTATDVNVTSTDSNFVISSNNCMSIIFKKSSWCSIYIKFNPLSMGVKQGDIRISYNNGAGAVHSSQTMDGEASALAYLKYIGIDTFTKAYEFGDVAVGSTKVLRALVRNVGLGDATYVTGSKSLGNNLHYRGNFNLSAIGKTINDYPVCSGVMSSATLCRHFYQGTSAEELFYNDNFIDENFDSAATYPDCDTIPVSICKINKNGPNLGVYIFAGIRSETDYSECGETITSGQTCQVVMEYSPATAESLVTNLSIGYVNDHLVRKDQADVRMNIFAKLLAEISVVNNNTIVGNEFVIPSIYNIGESTVIGFAIENTGDFDALISTITLSDVTQKNFTFNPAESLSQAPGKNGRNESGTCYPGTILNGRSACTFWVWFRPTEHGSSLSDTVKVVYNDGVSDSEKEFVIKAGSDSVARISTIPSQALLANGKTGVRLKTSAVQLTGNHVNRTITLKNSGDVNMTFTSLRMCAGILELTDASCLNGNFAEMTVDTSTATACNGRTLVPDETCTVDMLYSPESVHVSNYFSMQIDYLSSGYNLSKTVYGSLDAAAPSVVAFAAAGSTNLPYDFSLREYMEETPVDLVVNNTSSTVEVESLQFTIEEDSYNVFSIDNFNTSCPTSLTTFQTCTVRVKFIPTSVGDFTGKLKATYFDGQKMTSTILMLKGTGEPPRSTHKGWSGIIAVGEKINISSVSDSNIYAEVSWNDMLPKDGYTISGYNIYRRSGDGYYGGGTTKNEYLTPLNSTVISTAVKKYKDTTVTAGRIYYYEVRPVIMGFPSRTLENISEVRIAIPMPNMVFVHRWMANSLMCKRLGRTPDILVNSRCSYGGIGSKNNFYDIGYDMFVDRFELGADKTSRPGQLPIKTSQANIHSFCDAQGETTLFNISKTSPTRTFRKRIMSRKEFAVSSLWPATDTDAAILAREQSLTTSNNCNGASGGSVENTGNNSLCKSYFGLEDAAGNELEWVSDRIANGVGLTDQLSIDLGYELRLDTTNKDLDGVDFNALIPTSAPNLSMKDASCFTVPLGLSIPLNPTTGTCLNARISSSLGAAYFHDNIYSVASYADLKGMASGGAAYLQGTSGIYSSYWLGILSEIGGRCAIRLDY